MSNLLKKVRIVHSPLETKYTVEQKSVFGFRWIKIEDYPYVTIRNTSPHGVCDFAADALQKAKDKAEILLAKTVVWEQANYLWYQ